MLEDNVRVYLDKDILRQEQILQILNREDRWYQLDELALELNWAKNTISKDVLILNDSLPKGWEIQCCKGKGILLIKPLHSSLSNILYIVRKKTTIMRLLEVLLDSNCPSILSVSKKLHISYSGIKKLLTRLEEDFKKYNLTLKNHPLQIEGCEVALRSYIIKAYLSIYDNHWPFINYNQKEFINYLTMFERYLGIILFEGDKLRLSVCLCFIVKRIKKRKLVHMKEIDFKLLEDTTFFNAFSKVVPCIEKEQSITLHNNEVIYFVMQLIGANYRYKNEEMSKKGAAQRIRNNSSYIYYNIRCFIAAIEKKANISLFEDDVLLFHLSMCFKRILYKNKVCPAISMLNYPYTTMSDFLINSVKKEHPDLFRIIKTQYNIFFEKTKGHIADEEVTAITLHILATILEQKQTSITIILYITEHPGICRFLYIWIKKNFQNQINIIMLYELSKKILLEHYTCKLIITDAEIPFDTLIPVIKISGLPTKRDIKMIKNLINSV
ncbi:PRD domain-containing protein [Bacillus thuringiensis]|nr:PRD domain-containing protein [Bacillus thuringiensis]